MDRFTIDRMVGELDELYTELLSRGAELRR
jgi:hypothetical protein